MAHHSPPSAPSPAWSLSLIVTSWLKWPPWGADFLRAAACRSPMRTGNWRVSTQSQDRGGAAVEGSLSDNAHLRQFEERYRALVHSATDAIVTADSDGRIVSWNAAAERIFGHPADEVVGRPLSVLVPEPLRADHERGLRPFLSTGE